jgi:hypothetical protein
MRALRLPLRAKTNHTVPSGTDFDGLVPRHFMPGYDRTVPPAQNQNATSRQSPFTRELSTAQADVLRAHLGYLIHTPGNEKCEDLLRQNLCRNADSALAQGLR